MNEIVFYRNEDYLAIQDNLDIIIERSIKAQHKILDPKTSEYLNIKSIIMDYIISKKRIIYGGTAYHNIIEHFKKKEYKKIYKDYEYYDIEFYSPEPIADLINICDILNQKEIKYVMGRQAQHEETYTVFANFYQYCDISFMEKEIYNNVATIDINNVRYIDPSFILVDILRQFNDPLTSYWRLEKTFKRAKLLLENSNLKFKKEDINTEILGKVSDEIKNIINFFMREILLKIKKLVLIGDLPYEIYTNPETKQSDDRISKIEFFSRSLSKDLITIINIINKYCSENGIISDCSKYFKINKFYKFFQFWDSKIIVYYNNLPIIIMFGNNHRCIPCKQVKLLFNDKEYLVNIGSFMVNINYYLVSYHYYKIYKKIDKSYENLYKKYNNMIINCLDTRNTFLTNKHKTVLDKTLYQEFLIKCLGKTMEFTREFLVKLYSKKKKKKRIIFTYDPNETNYIDKDELKRYVHNNSTGLIRKKISI